jgi:hypothetical protein
VRSEVVCFGSELTPSLVLDILGRYPTKSKSMNATLHERPPVPLAMRVDCVLSSCQMILLVVLAYLHDSKFVWRRIISDSLTSWVDELWWLALAAPVLYATSALAVEPDLAAVDIKNGIPDQESNVPTAYDPATPIAVDTPAPKPQPKSKPKGKRGRGRGRTT